MIRAVQLVCDSFYSFRNQYNNFHYCVTISRIFSGRWLWLTSLMCLHFAQFGDNWQSIWVQSPFYDCPPWKYVTWMRVERRFNCDPWRKDWFLAFSELNLRIKRETRYIDVYAKSLDTGHNQSPQSLALEIWWDQNTTVISRRTYTSFYFRVQSLAKICEAVTGKRAIELRKVALWVILRQNYEKSAG